MKSTKSAAEIQVKDAIDHMEVMVSKQKVTIEDANYLISTGYKLLAKCEELRLSRDNWRKRAELAEKNNE
jgi:hypothetical protein